MQNSPVDEFYFLGRRFFVKRDDLLHPILGGNKARKFHTLINKNPSELTKIISHGGAQSNAMAALAYLCHQKGWVFQYYTRTIPKNLKSSPNGNLAFALKHNMQLIECLNTQKELSKLTPNAHELFIKQGGADPVAEEGVKLLSMEINDFVDDSFVVLTSCGTGTTALYLKKHLKCQIYAVPCVGDGEYLKRQWQELETLKEYPHIIDTAKKYRFGELHEELYEMYDELKSTGLEFDLLYDVKAWLAIKENIDIFKSKELLFLHSGGVHGNESMLLRYRDILLI